MCTVIKTNTFLYNVNCSSIAGALYSISSKLRPDDILRDPSRQGIIMSILDINMGLVKSQGLIVKSGNLSAFRTPFYSAIDEPIYALLKDTEEKTAPQPLTLIDFIVEGEGPGKLLKRFSEPPKLPTFTADRTDYLYDSTVSAPTVDFPHVHDRMYKLPVPFLATFTKLFGAETDGLSDKEIAKKAHDLVLTVPMADQMFRSMLSGTVAAAAKAAAADPYLARAIYYPRRGSISLLLPLCFTDKNRADCALVITKEKSGYAGQTLLSIQEAYADARLLGNVSSSWLVPSNV